MRRDGYEQDDGQKDESHGSEPGPWPPSRSLSWLNLWNRSPQVAAMWRAFSQDVQARGVLREIQLKGPGPGERRAVMMNVGFEPIESSDSPADESHSPFALLHTLPIYSAAPLVVQDVFTAMLPWRSPGLLGVIGHPPDDPSRRQFVFNFEMPVSYVLLAGRSLTKQELERLHLNKFMTDHLLSTGRLPFNGRIRQPEPPEPDFVFESDGNSIGVDCIQFSDARRREVHASFLAIRQAILNEPRERFAHLAGSLIYIWFGDDAYLSRAYRRGDKAAITALLESLDNYHVDPERLRVPNTDPFPEDHPDWNARTVAEGARFYGVPLAGDPNTGFCLATAFELGMGFSFIEDGDSAWAQFEQLVEAHDQPGFDSVLVTVGGPDRTGQVYISEEILLDAMLGSFPRDMRKPRHLSQIFIHSWETGLIAGLEWPNMRSDPNSDQPQVVWISPARRPTSIHIVPFVDGPIELGPPHPPVVLSAMIGESDRD